MSKSIPGNAKFRENLKEKKTRENADVQYVRDLSETLTTEGGWDRQVYLQNAVKKKVKKRQNMPEHKELRNYALMLSKQAAVHRIKRFMFQFLFSCAVMFGAGLGIDKIEQSMDGTKIAVDNDVKIECILFVFAFGLFGVLLANANKGEEDMHEFKKAVRKILSVQQLKDADGVEKFLKWLETNKDLKAEALRILETLSKKDRAYMDRLLNGDLDNADYATAVAIIAGHLESHPEEYNKVVEIFNESELPVGLKMKYGSTVMWNLGQKVEKEHREMHTNEVEPNSVDMLRDKIERGIKKVKSKGLMGNRKKTVAASKKMREDR